MTAVVFGACTTEAPPLVIADLEVTAPLPGHAASAAYFRLTNNSDTSITISHITSAEFESVEMHETRIAEGISRMRRLPETRIAPGETVAFERGGRHLMLMRPVTDVDTVTLSFFSGDSLLLASSTRIDRGD